MMQYVGRLAEPISPMQRPSLFDSPKHLNAELERIIREKREKLHLLYDLYGINTNDPNASKLLLWKLIEAHVTGFTVGTKKRRGAPTLWTTTRRLELISDVAKRVRTGQSIAAALRSKEMQSKYSWKDDKKAQATAFREYRNSMTNPDVTIWMAMLPNDPSEADWEVLVTGAKSILDAKF